MQQTYSPIFELGESNIFEEFYELIEKHRLTTSNKFSVEELYTELSQFDLAYQEFSSKNKPHSNTIVYQYLSHGLYCFLILFKFNGFSDRPLYWAFIRFIQFSTLLLKYSNEINNAGFYYRNINQNFPSLWRGPYLDILRENKINFNLYNADQYEQYYPILELAEKEISIDFGIISKEWGDSMKTNFKIYSSNFEVLELIWNVKRKHYNISATTYEMEITFKLSDKSNKAESLLQSLYLIVAALSNIDGVRLELEELKVGSLIGKIRLFIRDLFAKEETKAVLETTKEAVIKTITAGQVSHVDVKKANAETQKVNKETELLEKELSDKPSKSEAKLAIKLGLEKKALENEQLKIKNIKEKIEIIEKLSNLATKGILDIDEVKIDINGILYLLKSPNDINSPEIDIDQIT